MGYAAAIFLLDLLLHSAFYRVPIDSSYSLVAADLAFAELTGCGHSCGTQRWPRTGQVTTGEQAAD